MPTIPSVEAGHHQTRWYSGQDGHIHLNGANIIADGTAADAGPWLIESAADNITAFAGGGQASAVALVAQQNRVTNVANAGDSVKLPISAPGVEVTVINSGANPMQVFGAGTDTINGVATATGVSQPPNSVVEYSCVTAGAWFAEGLGVGFAGSFFTESAVDNITAFAGGGQASATLLTGQTNRVNTVATLGDSVKLPPSAAGLELVVINHGANAIQVYGSGTDQIDDVASATGVSQMKGSMTIYTCSTVGKWYTAGLGSGYANGVPTTSFTDGVTAFAGGGQASATLLTSTINRVTNVANAGDSIALPVSAAGMTINVINAHATNPCQVFGQGTDTVNGIATATGISQPAGSAITYYCTVAGSWICQSPGTGYSSQFPTVSVKNGITAFAGGGQGSAVLLAAVINRITTVGSANDSVKLPVSAQGIQITVTNAAAVNSMNLFPQTGDQINALGVNAAFAIPAGKTAQLTCAIAGQWHSVLSA